MNLFYKTQIIIFVIGIYLLPLAVPAQSLEPPPYEKWKDWIGTTINIAYDCCGEETCTIIRGAKLVDVTDKIITIISEGKQLLIPNYIITHMEHAK